MENSRLEKILEKRDVRRKKLTKENQSSTLRNDPDLSLFVNQDHFTYEQMKSTFDKILEEKKQEKPGVEYIYIAQPLTNQELEELNGQI